MKLERHHIINEFYTLSDLLDDDIDLIVEMIDSQCRVPCTRGKGKGTKGTRRKSVTRMYVERADYEKLASDIDYLLSMKIDDFNKAKREVIWKMSEEKKIQTSIFDFIKE